MVEPNEELVARVVSAVMRELGYGGEPAARREPAWPEWMPASQVRQKILKTGRTKFWQLRRLPTFPPGRRIGRDDFLNVPAVLRWIAENLDA
jgi:hypothetical protein